jgi:hypothetical protein
VANKKEKKRNQQSKPRPDDGFDDDTPRGFRRLMQYREKVVSPGLNNNENNGGQHSGGSSSNKKRKREDAGDFQGRATSRTKTTTTATTSTSTSEMPAIPKIFPGEKLSDFAARVDQALPLSGIKKSHKPASSDVAQLRDERVTKHEKRLRRLQQQWREEEARVREREAEERERWEAEHEEQLELWKEWEHEGKTKSKKKKQKRKKERKSDDKDSSGGDGDGYDDDDDPWAKLNARARPKKPFDPSDVVQAPPQLTKPKVAFKVRGTGGAKVRVADVPAAAGSLRRREELAEERKNVVEEYRRLMAERKSQ